jgi:copper chaperone
MNTYIFKTSINCNGCLSKVKPSLDNEPRITSWEIDLDNPDKILKVVAEDIKSSEIIDIIDNKGFEIELI